MTVRTRFAPSPTGFMHVGGVRTALFADIFAKQQGGQFLLRIEDTDKAREVEGSIPHIIESLQWLGITWDEGVDIGGPYAPYKQSERADRYKEVAQELLAKGYAYVDPYTQEQVEEWRKEAEEAKRPFLFREHRPEVLSTDWDGVAPLRFKVPEVKRYVWNDLVRGELSAGEEALDDFILIKGDGLPTYNMAHIVDDYDMKISHIMRGQEFISSTPKFLSLYEALGWQRPEIATMPVILGEEGGKKLGKRDGAKDILDYRDEGYLPEAMVNFLALLGWHPIDGSEILSFEEIIEKFDISKLQKAGARFDDDKLSHINREWLQKLTDEEYLERMKYNGTNATNVLKAIPLIKERASTFQEASTILADELAFISSAPQLAKDLLIQKEEVLGSTANHLRALETLIESSSDASVEDIKSALMPYADKEGRGAVLWPLRYALTGREKSPDPFTVIYVIGKEESLKRVRDALAIL